MSLCFGPPFRPSGKNVLNRDLAEFAAFQNEWDFVSDAVHLPLEIVRIVAGSGGLRIDFNLPVLQVDDPVDQNSGGGVEPLLGPAVAGETGIGDFDKQPDVLRGRM